MDRRPRNRIRKIEELLTAAKKARHEKRRKTYDDYRLNGRLHATAVAAIVLAGEPKLNEPLVNAWTRALQHYGIDDLRPHGIKNQLAAARELSPKIIGDAKESTKFTEIFRTAPVWLLNFTSIFIDAACLQFDLPRGPCTAKWGTGGYEQSREWPLLPSGTMADGDPIPEGQERLWPFPLDMKMKPDQIPDDEPDIQEEDEEFNFGPELERVADLGVLLDLAEDPQKEKALSRYQKLRLLKIVDEFAKKQN